MSLLMSFAAFSENPWHPRFSDRWGSSNGKEILLASDRDQNGGLYSAIRFPSIHGFYFLRRSKTKRRPTLRDILRYWARTMMLTVEEIYKKGLSLVGKIQKKIMVGIPRPTKQTVSWQAPMSGQRKPMSLNFVNTFCNTSELFARFKACSGLYLCSQVMQRSTSDEHSSRSLL